MNITEQPRASAAGAPARPGVPVTQRTALLVAGMHRSGTSALAGMLSRLGVTMPNTLMPADRNNERGYWESRPIYHFHERLLAAAGSRWNDWAELDATWFSSPEAAAFAAELGDLLASEYGAAALFSVKDPRLCRLTPFWRRVLADAGITSVALIPYRSPLEVASSLQQRDGMPITEGLLLWLRHILDAERATRSMRRSFVRYDRLLSGWRSEAERMARDLGLSWPDISPAAEADVGKFLSTDLRHHVRAPSDLSAETPAGKWTNAVLAALDALTMEKPGHAVGTLDAVREELNTAVGIFGPLVSRHLEKRLVAERDVRDLKASVSDFKVRLRRMEEEHAARLGEEAARFAKEVTRLNAEIAAAAERRQEFEQRLQAQSEEIDVLARRLREAENERLHRWSLARIVDRANVLARQIGLKSRRIRRLRRDAKRVKRSGLFDPNWYLQQYPDVAAAGVDPLVHYLAYGAAEGRNPNPLFDTNLYLARYPDVAGAAVNPLLHYIGYGAGEGRSPGDRFDPTWYLTAYPDVKAACVDPLAHYLRHGMAEGRLPMAPPAVVELKQPAPPSAQTPAAQSPAAQPRPAAWLDPPAWNAVPVPFLPRVSRRTVVFTACAGDYDEISAAGIDAGDVDFVCFTDRPIEAAVGWQLRGFDYFDADPTRMCRFVKLHPHVYFPDHEFSVWIDANVAIRNDIAGLVERVMQDSDMVLWQHYLRDCIYEEAAQCIRDRRDDPEVIEAQMQRVRASGYPANAGLVETNVLITRPNDPRIVDFMTSWWREIDNGSRRDQLSFNWVLRGRDLRIGYLGEKGESTRNHPGWELHRHNHVARYP